jgi:hypothetical protein
MVSLTTSVVVVVASGSGSTSRLVSDAVASADVDVDVDVDVASSATSTVVGAAVVGATVVLGATVVETTITDGASSASRVTVRAASLPPPPQPAAIKTATAITAARIIWSLLSFSSQRNLAGAVSNVIAHDPAVGTHKLVARVQEAVLVGSEVTDQPTQTSEAVH